MSSSAALSSNQLSSFSTVMSDHLELNRRAGGGGLRLGGDSADATDATEATGVTGADEVCFDEATASLRRHVFEWTTCSSGNFFM